MKRKECDVNEEKNSYKLPKNFFEENPLKELSTAQMAYFQMVTYSLPGFNEQTEKLVFPFMDTDRREQYESEKQQIFQISTAEDVIKYMRKLKEMQNRGTLVEKALSMQEEVVPLILKRLLKSFHDVYIEIAVMVLADADMKYVEQLYDQFHDIRSPYARSEACIVFGMKRRIDYTPLLLEQYDKMKQEYPGQGYEQGPLFALYLIHGE